MITYGVGKLKIQEDECTCSHSQTSDFFSSGRNYNYYHKRVTHRKNRAPTKETLPFD